MCSALGVAIGIEGAATVMRGIAAKRRGEAARAEDYRSADAAERSAGDAIERGKLKELQVTMRGSATGAAQKVIQSGTGVDVGIGAPKATRDATEAVTDVDRATVRRNAALEAYGFKGRARGLRQRGENEAAEGENAMVGTFLGGLGTIAGQAGTYAAGLKTPDEVVPDTSYGGGSAPDEAD